MIRFHCNLVYSSVWEALPTYALSGCVYIGLSDLPSAKCPLGLVPNKKPGKTSSLRTPESIFQRQALTAADSSSPARGAYLMPLIAGGINEGQLSKMCQIRFHFRQADVLGLTGEGWILPDAEASKSGHRERIRFAVFTWLSPPSWNEMLICLQSEIWARNCLKCCWKEKFCFEGLLVHPISLWI